MDFGVYSLVDVLECKDSENRAKYKINLDLFSFSRCILSSPRVKDSKYFALNEEKGGKFGKL